MTLKKHIIISLVTLFSIVASAQEKKFNPARFEADLEQFVATEARLTPAEAAVFFPLYREMRAKQFAYFSEQRRWCHVDETDEKACAEAVVRHDETDIEVKRIQKQYHDKFLRVIPATKVFRVLKAEDKFHRQLFKRSRSGGKKK